MQTFLPYPDFAKSAKCLDWRRCGKQRVEAMQILRILRGEKSRWGNHPAVKLWIGYEQALTDYMNVCIKEWISRGYKNTMKIEKVDEHYDLPSWFGNEEYHAAHRSNLLRKDFEYYSQFGWKESSDLPYIWRP